MQTYHDAKNVIIEIKGYKDDFSLFLKSKLQSIDSKIGSISSIVKIRNESSS